MQASDTAKTHFVLPANGVLHTRMSAADNTPGDDRAQASSFPTLAHALVLHGATCPVQRRGWHQGTRTPRDTVAPLKPTLVLWVAAHIHGGPSRLDHLAASQTHVNDCTHSATAGNPNPPTYTPQLKHPKMCVTTWARSRTPHTHNTCLQAEAWGSSTASKQHCTHRNSPC